MAYWEDTLNQLYGQDDFLNRGGGAPYVQEAGHSRTAWSTSGNAEWMRQQSGGGRSLGGQSYFPNANQNMQNQGFSIGMFDLMQNMNRNTTQNNQPGSFSNALPNLFPAIPGVLFNDPNQNQNGY